MYPAKHLKDKLNSQPTSTNTLGDKPLTATMSTSPR